MRVNNDRNLKFMNLTAFHPNRKRSIEDKNNLPVYIRFVPKTSDIRNFTQN